MTELNQGPSPPDPGEESHGKGAGQPTRYHVVMFQQPETFPLAHLAQIDRGLFAFFKENLDKIITTAKEDTEIDVWIDSLGGDAHAAYKMMLEFRSRCKTLRAVIPDRAKSAATLMVLGMDEVFMAASAELGPLDAQIDHPGKDNVTISALDVADSLSFMGEAAFDIGFTGGAEVVFDLGLPRIDVLNSVLQFAAQLVAPVAAKLDPHLIHQATNQLRVTEQYALALIADRRHKSAAIPPNASAEMVRKLVKEYPAHGYVISRDEARKLGLVVDDAETHPRWEAIRATHHLFKKRRTSVLQVIPDSLLDRTAKEKVKLDDDDEAESSGQSGGSDAAAAAAAPK